VAYRFNTAEYYGTLSNGAPLDQQFGEGGVALPVSGTYGGTGTFIYGTYYPSTATWAINLPQPGGFVTKFGDPGVDVPVPGDYNGGGIDYIATFRPVAVSGNDADSFNVATSSGIYQVSFTNPVVEKLGFTYKAGDIPAPADYDGVGRDEFAIYRPSTGQFFILNTPNVNNTATWTLRTVSLNLPGGPNVNDVPVSEDYDGNGKADPAVYRPSTSTFFIIHSSTGIQSNIQFGQPGGAVAAAGPLLYRLTALKGSYASTDGYAGGTDGSPGSGTSSSGGGSSVGAFAFKGSTNGSTTVSAAATSTSSTVPVASLIAVASPMLVTQTASTPVAATPTIPTSIPTTTVNSAITVGVSTPKTSTKVHHPKAKVHEVTKTTHTAEKKPAKTLKVETKPVVETKTKKEQPQVIKAASPAKTTSMAGLVLQKLVLAMKGKKKKD